MKIFSNRKTIWATIGVLASVVIMTAGVLILVVGGRQSTTSPGAQPPASLSTSPPAADASQLHAPPISPPGNGPPGDGAPDSGPPAIAVAPQFPTSTTSVQAGFTGKAAPPAMNDVRTAPVLPVEDGWLRLPAGAGSVTFTVQASATDRLEFYLTPTGTETAPLAKLLGTGTKTGDEFTFAWDYPAEPLAAHLELVATGPGGRTELSPFNVYHE